jgi:hypothetical protein
VHLNFVQRQQNIWQRALNIFQIDVNTACRGLAFPAIFGNAPSDRGNDDLRLLG